MDREFFNILRSFFRCPERMVCREENPVCPLALMAHTKASWVKTPHFSATSIRQRYNTSGNLCQAAFDALKARISCDFLRFDQTEDIWLKFALKVKRGVLLTSVIFENFPPIFPYLPKSNFKHLFVDRPIVI
jgi:hypothetical protein